MNIEDLKNEPLFFHRDGTPYTGENAAIEWAKEFQNLKRVALDVLRNGKVVSTVWLGINHSFGGAKPLIFESMVFPRQGEFGELDCRRYATEQEALEGHAELVKEWSK